jgi:phosphatidylinositol alpha-1,6-mannosyltransferase
LTRPLTPTMGEVSISNEQERPLRVLTIATDGFGGHGGIAQYTRDMLTALCAHPSRPTVLAVPRVMRFPPGRVPDGLEWVTSSIGGKGAFVREVAKATYRLRPIDLVVCTHIHLLPVAFCSAKLAQAPLILFVYGIEAAKPTTKAIVNALVKHVDAVVSIRDHTTTRLMRWSGAERVPTFLLHNPIHMGRYGLAPKDPELVRRFNLQDRTVVLTMGRVEESNKGFDEVLEVLPRVARTLSNVTYVIAGDGYDVPRLRDKAQSLGVADRVVFTGLVAEDRKADYYRLADAFVMAGRSTQFDRYPLRFVFLEAMACGVPVVGPRPEPADESANEGSLLARQVDPFDAAGLERAILEAVAMPKVIPPALAQFAYPNFQKKLHGIVDAVMATDARSSRAATRQDHASRSS